MLPIERKAPMKESETDMSWLDSFCEKLSPEECAYLRTKLDDSVPTGLGEEGSDDVDDMIPIEPKGTAMSSGYGDREDSEEDL